MIRIGLLGDAGESLSTTSETKDDILCILGECAQNRAEIMSTTCCKRIGLHRVG